MEKVVIFLYAFFSLFIFCYSLVQAQLLWTYLKNKKSTITPKCIKSYPFVTIQLPIFNEKYVIERLIDQVILMNYPKDRFEIQILDDSTDDTKNIVAEKVIEVQNQGFNIQHFTRPSNVGFKAGALKEGMESCKGEFIAIFDADFLPDPEFLNTTIPYFEEGNIGVVQTKWEHLNKNYSLLTLLQAYGLDAHFTIEQSAKNTLNHYINFNGTAGVWRKTCIEDAGGWQSDTITEDLDLSYRAQMKGWKFKYIEEFGSPAELPVTMNALKNQQFRWTKGAAECAKKNLIQFLKTPSTSLSTKLHGTFHLLNSFLFICILAISVLSIPLLIIKNQNPDFKLVFQIASTLLLSSTILFCYYFVAFIQTQNNKFKAFLKQLYLFPMFLSVSMGLSMHNAIAVFEGYIGKKSPFVRTPKFNITNKSGSWKDKNHYLKSTINLLTLLEISMMFYAISGIFLAFHYQDFGLIPFHIMLAVGFGYVATYSVIHSRTVKT